MKNPNSINQVKYFRDISTVVHARMNRFLLKPVLPRLITYCVTYRCNCRCTMCEMFKKAEACREELSANDIGKIFADRVFARLDVVRFTGGEPFLKNDIGDIVSEISRLTNARIFYITTNGSFPEKVEQFIEKVMPLGIQLHVQISLDDVSELHDRIRGVTGLFEKAYSTLETLQKLKKKWRFETGINQTISKENMTRMQDVNLLAKKFGCAHNITLAVKHHEGRSHAGIDFSRPIPFATIDSMDDRTIRDIYSKIDALKHENYTLRKKLASSSLRDLLEGYLNEGGRNRLLYQKDNPKPPCTAFFTHFRLLPNGDAVSCSIRGNRVVGNLRDKTFSDIWHSDSARKERKSVRACAGCWSECDMAPSIFYSGDIIKWALKKLMAS